MTVCVPVVSSQTYVSFFLALVSLWLWSLYAGIGIAKQLPNGLRCGGVLWLPPHPNPQPTAGCFGWVLVVVAGGAGWWSVVCWSAC